MCKDPGEAGNIESLNSDASSLPVDEVSPIPVAMASQPTVMLAFLPPSKAITPALPKGTMMTSVEAIGMRHNANLLGTLLASGPISYTKVLADLSR
jgi:hypothetical protein